MSNNVAFPKVTLIIDVTHLLQFLARILAILSEDEWFPSVFPTRRPFHCRSIWIAGFILGLTLMKMT